METLVAYGILKLCEDDVRRVLADVNMDPTMKNKRGVEIHNKLIRVEDFLDELPSNECPHHVDLYNDFIVVLDELLSKIFGINTDPHSLTYKKRENLRLRFSFDFNSRREALLEHYRLRNQIMERLNAE